MSEEHACVLDDAIKLIEKDHCATCQYGVVLSMLRSLSAAYKPVVQKEEERKQEMRTVTRAKRKYTRRQQTDANAFEKACNVCHVVKPLSEYEPNKGCADGHIGQCKSCRKEKARLRHERVAANMTTDPINDMIDEIAASTRELKEKRSA